MAIIYGLKVNLSVAMVAMLNHTALAHESGHGTTPANGSYVDTSVEAECQGSGDAEAVEVIILNNIYSSMETIKDRPLQKFRSQLICACCLINSKCVK